MNNIVKWGVLPDAARNKVLCREWENLRNLKDRLLTRRPFPIVVPLKAPKGNAAVNDLSHFQNFVDAWRNFPNQKWVRWEQRNYRTLLTQSVPTAFELPSFADLILFLGISAEKRQAHWRMMMRPLLEIDKGLYPVCVEHLTTFDGMNSWQSQALADTLRQLRSGMGEGLYLRALPLTGIHTKFLETFSTIITDMLDWMYSGQLRKAGGLKQWLACKDPPRNWLYVRPLCDKAQAAMGGFSNLQLSMSELAENPLPAKNILIVENVQPGYALPALSDTIAVFGGGINTAWVKTAKWLSSKNVAYWGDIDTWGFKILSDVREKIPHVTSLMMNEHTFMRFQHFVTTEPDPCRQAMSVLTRDEQEMVEKLTVNHSICHRLEQEYLPADHVVEELNHWVDSDNRYRKQ